LTSHTHSAASTDIQSHISPRQQVALAYAARLSGKKAVIFIPKSNVMTPLSSLASALGAKMKRVSPGYLKSLQREAERYVQLKKGGSETIELLPFGLHSDEFIDMLAGHIKAALPTEHLETPPSRLWLVAGSGTTCLYYHQTTADTDLTLYDSSTTYDGSVACRYPSASTQPNLALDHVSRRTGREGSPS
jgi:hypothetical protein